MCPSGIEPPLFASQANVLNRNTPDTVNQESEPLEQEIFPEPAVRTPGYIVALLLVVTEIFPVL